MKYRIKGPPPKTGFSSQKQTHLPLVFLLNPGPFSNPREREPQPLFEWDCFSSLSPFSSFSYFYILSLSLSLCRANLTTRGALVTSLISRENRQAYIHDGRALIGYPASGREQPPSKKGRRSSLRRLPDSRDLTLPDRRLLFHGGGSGGFRFERAINR